MPPFDNSIYFPYEARRGSSRLYFSLEKSTLWMASIIFSSPVSKDCILWSLFFLKDHGDIPTPEKLHFERRPSATRKLQTRTTHCVKNNLTPGWKDMQLSTQVNLCKLFACLPCWRYNINPDHLLSVTADAGQNMILRSNKIRPCYSSASSSISSNEKKPKYIFF